jgi:hypothetical protein
VLSRGGSLLANRVIVVLTALVNTGAKKLWVLAIGIIPSYVCGCPSNPWVLAGPRGLLPTKFPLTLDHLSVSKFSLKSGGVEFVTVKVVCQLIDLAVGVHM